MADFVIVGNPENRRVTLFQEALKGLDIPAARVVSYLDILAWRDRLFATSPDQETIVRIESPGENFEVERGLLALGAVCDDPDGDYERLSTSEVEALQFEQGRILPSRQWYLGYCALLNQLAGQLGTVKVMNTPVAIQRMFDKRDCHAHLQHHGLSVPACLPAINSYDALIAYMRQTGWNSVFIKPAHGSSASGVVAYRINGQQHRAITTVEAVQSGGEMRLYNSLRMQTYRDVQRIAPIIDALCHNRVHVEQWIPKAGIAGKTFDVRIVVIDGQAQHSVVRMSHSPITNLHLLNERGDLNATIAQIGEENWTTARQTCERAARLFSTLYSGIDLMFTSNYRRHAILEMNAFGDLLPRVVFNGHDTYTAQLLALRAKVGLADDLGA